MPEQDGFCFRENSHFGEKKKAFIFYVYDLFYIKFLSRDE